MAWFPEKSSTRYERLTQEKRRLDIQWNGLDLARSEIEKIRQHEANRQAKEWLSSGLHAPD